MNKLVILAVAAVLGIAIGTFISQWEPTTGICGQPDTPETWQQISKAFRQQDKASMPPSFNDSADCAMLVRHRIPGGEVQSHFAQGGSLAETLAAAIDSKTQAIHDKIEVRFDIVTNEVEPDKDDPIGLDRRLKPHEGFYSAEEQYFVTHDQIIMWNALYKDERPKPNRLKRNLPSHVRKRMKAGEMPRVHYVSAYCNATACVKMLRGNPERQSFADEELKQVLIDADRYLRDEVNEDGAITYIYNAEKDETGKGYNILRHGGTTYSMMELYERNKHPDTLAAVKRAIKYLQNNTQSCPEPTPEASCIVEKGSTKLGGNALAVVAIAKYQEQTGDESYLPFMRQLADRMVGIQRDSDGGFSLHKQRVPSGEDTGFVSGYYPGEAILGLMRLHQLGESEKYLESAERAADYLIQVRDKGKSIDDLDHDHWLLYGLNELYRYRPKQHYLDHARKITTAIRDSQQGGKVPADWVGGFSHPPRSTPSATRVEGMVAAYSMFKHAKQEQDAELLLPAIRGSITYQLRTYIGPEVAMVLPNPQRALGGFRESLTGYEVRNDFVQHNVSAIHQYLRQIQQL